MLYKVHVAENGWTDWMKNGDVAGTTGKKLRLEAYRVKVVPKGFDKNISSYQKLTAEVYNVTFNPMGDYAILHLKKYRTVAFMALYQNQLRIRIFLLVGMTLLILIIKSKKHQYMKIRQMLFCMLNGL